MKVLTWNILADQYIDYNDLQRDYPTIDATSLRSSKRVPIILSHLVQQDADIMFLQEVTPETAQRIQQHWNNTHQGTLTLHRYKNADSGNLTLFRTSLFQDLETESKFFGGSHNVTNISVCHSVDSGTPLVTANVHFDWENAARRKREANGLVRFLTKQFPNSRIIVAGDFNTDQDAVHRKFRSKAFVGALHKATSTFLCEKPMIDFIYGKNIHLTHGKVHNHPIRNPQTCFQNTIREFGSDHYMVTAHA
jgi:endonuclease/exonuclease/phosphatase family metal-dependent hydrolase